MTHYSATKDQLADEMERRADEATGKKYVNAIDLGREDGLREAATLVRNTRLADPAMEAENERLREAHTTVEAELTANERMVDTLKDALADAVSTNTETARQRDACECEARRLQEAMEAMVKALEKIEAQAVCVALSHSFEESDAWLVAIAKEARSALKLAKDNGHV